MRCLWRIARGVLLASYLGLMALQSAHHHRDMAAPSDCQLCIVAHGTPALLHAPTPLAAATWSGAPTPLALPHPDLAFVFDSHGLSPPVL